MTNVSSNCVGFIFLANECNLTLLRVFTFRVNLFLPSLLLVKAKKKKFLYHKGYIYCDNLALKNKYKKKYDFMTISRNPIDSS